MLSLRRGVAIDGWIGRTTRRRRNASAHNDCCIGKVSFESDKLWENASALIDVVLKAKPASTKGTYMKKVSVSSTMGPGFKVDPASPLKTTA